MSVERIPGGKRWNWDERVTAHVADQVLDRSLLMRLGRTTEERVEEIVRTQPTKVAVLFSLWSGQDAGDGRLGIVVHALARDAA